MNDAELKIILQKHKEWLNSEGKEGERADLREAKLMCSNLEKIDLRYADCRGASFENSSLVSSDLRGADFSADLEDSILKNVNFENCIFEKADLRHADLTGANLERTYWRYADLRHAKLTSASLKNARFMESNLMDADFCGADVRGADFRKAIITRLNLTFACLDDAKWGCSPITADYFNNTVWPPPKKTYLNKPWEN